MIIRNANIIDIEKIANLYVTNWSPHLNPSF